MDNASPNPVKPEELLKPTDKYLQTVGDMYHNFYKYRSQRNGIHKQIKNMTLNEYWTQSRELFWNSTNVESEDLEAMGLDFSLPFIRKEVLDFTGRLVSLGIIPEIEGENIGSYGIKALMAMQKKYRFKSKDKVEKFWQVLYGVINGTLCTYVGFDTDEREFKYLTSLSDDRKTYTFDTRKKNKWNDAFTEVVPIEEMYLEKMWERNIQKQGKVIRRQEMTQGEFDFHFPKSKYPLAQHVVPGNRVDTNSLFFQLISGSKITDRIEVLTEYDIEKDEKKVVATGIWINPLGKDTPMPNPFTHKMHPYTWTMNEPNDEKFAYGASMPMNIKDPTKILNASYTMLVERELRAIDPPVISSDFEAPQLIFGQNKVIPVNDVNAYKEFKINEASGAYYTMMNSLQGLTTSFAQGGSSQVAPSRQPKSAREIMDTENMKKQALGNALIMYYDLIHQETLLLLKTMLQFYPAGDYSGARVLRELNVPNMPMSRGGIGNLEVRFVKEPQKELDLYFEAVKKSIENGKMTEIVEIPIDVIENLEWYITNIKLEPEKSTEMERATYVEQVLSPMLKAWIPMGVADPYKAFLRHLEKMGESAFDYTPDRSASGITTGASPSPIQMPMGAQTGNMNQSIRGTQFGNQNVEPLMDKLAQ